MRLKLLSGTAAVFAMALFLSACNLSQVMQGIFGPPPTPVAVTVIVTPLAATPTSTPFPPKPMLTPAPAACNTPAGWFNYVVQPGDTLARIAARANASAAALAQANCLANMNLITTGQVLKVPILLPTTTPPVTPPTATVTGRNPHLEQGVTSPDSWMNADAGNFRLRAGSTVNVTWYDAPGGLASVTFFTTSMRGTRQDIGVDNNPSDGATLSWTVPYGLDGHQLRADGFGLNAAPFEYAVSLPSYVYSDTSAEQCYVQVLADQPLYAQPDSTAASVGTAPGSTVWPVIGASNGWVQISYNSGWLPPDGAISTYGTTCP